MIELEAAYLKMPTAVQQTLCSLEGWRVERRKYRGAFPRLLSGAESRAFCSVDQVRSYRDARLRAFVRHCAESVPFYQRLFRKIGVAAEDIRSFHDLEHLPVLRKEDVQRDYSQFLATTVPSKNHVITHTSGTTGAGLRFRTTNEAIQEQYAIWWRYRRWHGIQLGTWCGYFGGRSVVPLEQKRPPFWRYNYPGRQILFSGYHIGTNTIDDYIDLLRSRQPPWLHGYPSLLSLIAEHLVNKRMDLGYQVRWITTGAENLLEHQAELIEAAFGVKARSHYGMAEAVANISECEYGKMHVDEDFSAVEFIPTGDGDQFTVVGTNLTNPAMPLLRYETEDVVTLSEVSCSCGRPGRVITHIDGRIEDYVILHSGARLGRLDHIFKDLTNIKEAQIYQKRIGEITLRIVRSDRYTEQDEAKLLHETRLRVGSKTDTDIHYVDRIERSSNGKLRFVISELPEGHIRNADSAAPN